ncbi:MAG: RES family NAD+ phosphorylase [Opitutaceae bacterium]
MIPQRLNIWRVEKEVFVPSARTGEGARIVGGRWNSPGLAAIYCAESLALAVLEILVHAATVEERADPRVWFKITLPEVGCRSLPLKRLPKNWNDPLIHPETVSMGDQWLRAKTSVALRVPSAVVPGAWNIILNPQHPEFRKLVRWAVPKPLQIDARLIESAPGRA